MNIKFIEEFKRMKKALEEIANPDWKECNNYISAFEKAQRLADDALRNTTRSSFFVLKQFNGTGPIYKVEVCSETLEVLEKEVVDGIPEGWNSKDFYEMLDEGRRLALK